MPRRWAKIENHGKLRKLENGARHCYCSFCCCCCCCCYLLLLLWLLWCCCYLPPVLVFCTSSFDEPTAPVQKQQKVWRRPLRRSGISAVWVSIQTFAAPEIKFWYSRLCFAGGRGSVPMVPSDSLNTRSAPPDGLMENNARTWATKAQQKCGGALLQMTVGPVSCFA